MFGVRYSREKERKRNPARDVEKSVVVQHRSSSRPLAGKTPVTNIVQLAEAQRAFCLRSTLEKVSNTETFGSNPIVS